MAIRTGGDLCYARVELIINPLRLPRPRKKKSRVHDLSQVDEIFVAGTRRGCSSEKLPFKSGKKKKFRVQRYALSAGDFFCSPMWFLKHIPQSTPTALPIEWLY